MPIIKYCFRDNLIAAILLYAIVLIYQGYQYGQSDQSQILPVLYAQDHPEAYATDHYVNAYLRSGVNERTIFHALLRYAGYQVPWLVFLWHAIASIALILAWIRIGGVFIKHDGLRWLSIGLILILGFHTNTGSNELYYNQFVPSLAAKALASWGLYGWVKEKYSLWSILLVAAGFLQPLVGIQLFLVTTGAIVMDGILNGALRKLPWRHIAIYLIFTIPWVYLLAINNGGHEDPKAFMEFIEFRLSHHFYGSYFGTIQLMLTALFAGVCLAFYKKKLTWVFILIVIGCIFYEVGVEVLRSPVFLYTQWWKTTIWIEAFASIALIGFFENRITILEKLSRYKLLIPVGLLAGVAFYRLSGLFGVWPEYMAPLSNIKSDEVDISEQAQSLTPPNSVFIIPPDLSAFRWYSRRGTYVDYKAMNHSEEFLQDWYHRIGQAYNYNLSVKLSGATVYNHAKDVLDHPTPDQRALWKSLGITHIISYSSDIGNLELVGRNKSYAIYRLL